MADNFNLDDFLIDRIRRGTMFSDTTGEALWSITQISDASLSMTSETADVTDAIGNIITQFDRSKNAEFSGSNAIWNMGLTAAQAGTEKKIATKEKKLTVPMYEQLDVNKEDHTIILAHIPVGETSNEIKYVYKLNNDSSLGQRYELAPAGPEETQFTLNAAERKITFNDAVVSGTFAVFYDYESESAIMIENNASEFPKAGKFMLEVIGKNTCDKTKTYICYIVFPNAKLKTDVDLSFTSDGGHPFTLQMMQDYCDPQKLLYRAYIAN